MTKVKDIKSIFDLMSDVESYTLQAYQDTLSLSEKLKDSEDNSPNKPPFALNYLEYYNTSEPVTSWIIRHIFAYKYGARHPFFDSFAEVFLKKVSFNPEWIECPIIDKDHEFKGIDILVRDKRYAVIIENKLKGADFQLNQLARYIATMRNEGYTDEQIFVVVLPGCDMSKEDLRESVWNLPKDWHSTSQSRKCRIDSYTCWCDGEDFQPKAHCNKCEPLKEIFEKRTLFIHKELSKWFYSCVNDDIVEIPKEELDKQYVLKSAILQFVDYLNFIYNTRENDKYKMDIEKFLNDQLKLNNLDIVEQLSLVEEKINDVEELANQLDNLFESKIQSYIDDISRKHKVHLVRNEDDEDYFHYNIKVDGKTLAVSVDQENNADGPFCQIQTKGQRKIPEIITEDFEISEELNDKNNRNDCIWRYDSYKESLLRFDRVLGRLLEIISQDKSIDNK